MQGFFINMSTFLYTYMLLLLSCTLYIILNVSSDVSSSDKSQKFIQINGMFHLAA